jgi:hypothetical protein
MDMVLHCVSICIFDRSADEDRKMLAARESITFLVTSMLSVHPPEGS